eukprot:scaffold8150_cov69-Cyclotella_meneghiniana.AAC.6
MIIKPALLHFKFDGFADLPSEVDSRVYSYVQTDCNGNKWKLCLYPGGENDADEPGWIALYLHAKGHSTSLDTRFRFGVKNVNGAYAKQTSLEYMFELGSKDGYGSHQFMKRDIILDPNNNILKDGALCIDVMIQVKDDKDNHYDPESKLTKKMMKLLESEYGADASFKVGDCTFRVHSHILHNNAPILASHLHPPKSKKKSSIVIEGISAPVFEMVLAYVYAEQRPSDEEVLEHGDELIDAANRYELVDLKVAVEHVLVRERILTTENVCDYILFADAQSCALLKEYAISFFLLNAEDVLKSKYSKCLKESGELLAEILLMSRSNEGAETLTVNELRKELGKRKLDVDGSKDALVKRLEEAKRQRSE